MDPIQKALQFAYKAHSGQLRRYTNVPYIIHPITVAHMVAGVQGATEAMVIAALLHDVVEDTPYTPWDIQRDFGSKVEHLVHYLTDQSPELCPTASRAIRKDTDLVHTRAGPPEAKTIKLADLIHNSESIIAHDPRFAHTYMMEKKLLLAVLTEGDAELHRIATSIVDNYYRKSK